jgi:hypothetical protein
MACGVGWHGQGDGALRSSHGGDYRVVVVELGALAAAGVKIVADRDDPFRVLVRQLLQTLHNSRVDAAYEVDDRLVRPRMHQRYTPLEPHDAEVRLSTTRYRMLLLPLAMGRKAVRGAES